MNEEAKVKRMQGEGGKIGVKDRLRGQFSLSKMDRDEEKAESHGQM